MGKSVFYIAQLDEILGEVKKAFNAQFVTVWTAASGSLSIRIVTNDLKNDLDCLTKMRDKVVEIFGINNVPGFNVMVKGNDSNVKLVFENKNQNLEIEIVDN